MSNEKQMTHQEADRLRIVQGFAEPFLSLRLHTAIEGPPLPERDAMTTAKAKALDLLRYWVEQSYDVLPAVEAPPKTKKKKGKTAPPTQKSQWAETEKALASVTVAQARTRPDATLGTPAEVAAYEKQLRRDMAKELRRMKQPVRRTIIRDGEEVTYLTTSAVLEIRRLTNHPSCRRVVLCERCCRKADEAGEKRPLACRCPSSLQRWVWKLLRQVEFTPKRHGWGIAYVLLILRDVKQHWYDNRIGIADPKIGKYRLHKEVEREKELGLRRPDEVIEEYDDDDKLVKRTTVSPSDGTSRLSVDLRGWDRPSSMGRRTQRLAFCPECMVKQDPWFLVGKSVPFGSAKCNHKLGEGAVCGATEIEPPPRSGKIPTYTVTRRRRVGGKVVPVVHEFYRMRGRWTWTRTNEQAHMALHHELEKRWLDRIKKSKSA